MTDRPFISFMTDFGVGSSAPSVCRGVMLDIAPDARLVDVTHAIRHFALRDGAFLLARSVPYFPIGVHVAVVDPGVGTARRPIALHVARGDYLVGPNNGLLVPAAHALGGIVAARALENRALWLPSVSHTFHGRDIF
ncbi:MAG: SAM hydrolase/SAM-dependent halogenase family protein, partial [Candidatus Limnocylindria bacterium]